MKINITKKQYITLIKSMYLATYMTGIDGENNKKIEFEDLEKYFLSFADKFDVKDKVEKHKWENFPGKYFDDELEDIIDEHNNDNFWEELVYRLAKINLSKIYSEKELNTMSSKEFMENLFSVEDKYRKVFEKGLEVITVKGID